MLITCQVGSLYVIIIAMKTLKAIREDNALSIRDLAQAAGVSPSTIARIESGLPARPMNRRKIAKALHCKPQDINW